MQSFKFEKKNLTPIIIGMTGHRDLKKQDILTLESKVKSIIMAVQNKYPNTPICILSQLAEGADRLVAKVGLTLGADLYTVLPMPQIEYEKDFLSNKSKKEFREFVNISKEVIEMPYLKENSAENIKGFNKFRNLQYEQAGAYIVKYSQIFIALWDGVNSNETGGTAWTTKFRLDGIPEKYKFHHHPLNIVDSSPVYHIITTRDKKKYDKNTISQDSDIEYLLENCNDWNILYPSKLRKEAEYFEEDDKVIIKKQKDFYHRIFKRIDDFNYNAKKIILNKKKIIDQSKSYIFSNNNKFSAGLQKILNCYAIADTLAIHYQQKTRKSKIRLISLAVLGFLFLSFFDEIFSFAFILLMVPMTFLFAYLLFRIMHKNNYDNNFYDYRALAEGLRVQLFWKIPGWKENVTEYYLRKFDGEINWIAIAISSISISVNNEINKYNDYDEKECIKKVYDNWILNQKNYFNKRSSQKTYSVEKQNKSTTLLFFLAMTGVIVLFFIQWIYIYKFNDYKNIFNMEGLSDWKIYHYLLLIIDLLLASGAAYGTYITAMAFAEEARQYQRMTDLFFRGERMINEYIKTNDWNKAKEIIIELGKEALTENGDWLLTKRSRPIEIPTA